MNIYWAKTAWLGNWVLNLYGDRRRKNIYVHILWNWCKRIDNPWMSRATTPTCDLIRTRMEIISCVFVINFINWSATIVKGLLSFIITRSIIIFVAVNSISYCICFFCLKKGISYVYVLIRFSSSGFTGLKWPWIFFQLLVKIGSKKQYPELVKEWMAKKRSCNYELSSLILFDYVIM